MYDTNIYSIIIFVLIIVLLLFLIFRLFQNLTNEYMINITPIDEPTWNRNSCNYTMNEMFRKILSEYNIKYTDDNADIIIPCTYNNIDREIDTINPHKDQRIFIINNADHIAAKDYLWKMLIWYYGLTKAKQLAPNTYIINSDDMIRFKEEYKEGMIYIMKKNIQRQEGIKITDSYQDIMDTKDSYVVIQNLLQDPYTINSRKINMRFYILVICNNDNIDVYVYDNGFMYYTREEFKKGTTEFGPNITTGYIERWIYEINPLTHGDFKKYLDEPDRKLNETETILRNKGLRLSKIVFTRIYHLFNEVFRAISGHICNCKKLKSSITFQLFGADIAINEQLYPMIMEINKGPDLGAKDERDGTVKRGCIIDMLVILGLIKKKGMPEFIKILDKEKDKFNPVHF